MFVHGPASRGLILITLTGDETVEKEMGRLLSLMLFGLDTETGKAPYAERLKYGVIAAIIVWARGGALAKGNLTVRSE